MLLPFLLCLACANVQGQQSPSELPTEIQPMPIQLTLESPDELPALQQTLNSTTERQQFVIQLGPGPFQNTVLAFGSQNASSPKHDLEIEGQATVLENSSLMAIGETVAVRGIRTSGAPESGPPIRVHANESIRLSNVHISQLSARPKSRGVRARGGAAELRALSDGVIAHLEHVTLMESTQPISFASKPGGRFADIRLDSVRLHATAHPAISTGPAQWIHVGDVQQTTGGDSWLRITNPTTLQEGEATSVEPSEDLLKAWSTGAW